MTTRTAPPARRRSRVPLTIALVTVAVLLILLFFAGQLYADFMWFDELGFAGVLTTQWWANIVLFLVGFLGMAVPVYVSISLAYRFHPVYQSNPQIERYRDLVDPLRRLMIWGIPIVFGLFAGVAAAARWSTVLMWLNGTPTEATDPQFGLPISFYLFELPFYRGLVSFASAVVFISAIVAVLTALLYGALRISGREVWLSRAARVQLAVTIAVYVALQAVSIWLDQYATLSSTSTPAVPAGASYADVWATIPGRAILAGIALIVAALFIYTAIRGRWRLAVIGTGLLIVTAIIAGGVYPWIVQRFTVAPNERAYESEYLQRNIDSTREAYGVADIIEQQYDAQTTTDIDSLREDAQTTASVRIIDPSLVTDNFSQSQQLRQYYQFPEYLDVDRYEIDGETQDTVLALRELNPDGLGSDSWVNQTLVYTHGYGIVAAAGNERTANGSPVYIERDIPTEGVLPDYEPRVYFGEFSPTYSIVGGPEGAAPVELDYPADATPGATPDDAPVASETNTVQYTFEGEGGPLLDNFFTRLIYAVKFSSEQILLSDAITNDSQILYDRDPLTRVQKVAPYLTLDSDPYPAIVDGRIQWVVDGYTTSADYPYSTSNSLQQSIADTYTPEPLYAVDNVNYIRNSVKATVDAYDGSVTLYAWDDQDPLLQTWSKVFPSTLRPISEMSGDLLSHVRYPADLFKMQRTVLGRYHVTNPGSFYESNDAWVTPSDPATSSDVAQPPYYLSMQLPGEDETQFRLYSTFIPQQSGTNQRNVLLGYLTANADAGAQDGVKGEDYGKLTLLSIPTDSIPGPGQIQNSFNSDQAEELNLIEQQATTVVRANLLTLPVGGGFMYVQPIYVRSTGGTSLPIIDRILVTFGDEIGFGDTLDE